MFTRKREQVRERVRDLRQSDVEATNYILTHLIEEGVTLERDIDAKPEIAVISTEPLDGELLYAAEPRPTLRGRYAVKACVFIGNVSGTPRSFSPYTGERLGSAMLVFEAENQQMYGQFMTDEEYQSLAHQVSVTTSGQPHGI